MKGKPMQSICLSMIVKNEAQVIRRCLDSVRPIISHWVIVDTGSTDGTQDIIREYMKDMPGELYERPWRDFAHNRSEALVLARPHGEYSLIIDADDALALAPDFELPELQADSYVVDIHDTATYYQRTQLVRNALPWRYQGVLHEYLTCEGAGQVGHLPVVMLRNHDGARRKDPQTYRKDAEILERALATEEDAFLVSRYRFYLAQSYRDCGELAKAEDAYMQRAELGFWDEEIYMSLLEAGRLQENLNRDFDTVMQTFARAMKTVPHRAEAAHAAALFCRNRARHQEGYDVAKRALGLLDAPMPDGLFMQPWVYQYGLLDEFSINAYWSGHYAASLNACLKILAHPSLPEGQRQRVLDNAKFAAEKLPGEPNLGRNAAPDLIAQHAVVAARPLRSRLDKPAKILIAILAKQKAPTLPLYLECIEALDYPKTSIVLYIRTNNNTDTTEQILRDWVARIGHLYAGVEFDADDVATRVEQFGVHEWNETRFRVLGRIRNISLRRTLEHGCDFYFVADCDNFVRPCTLRELVALNLPIVAPFLRSISPGAYYSNYHAEIDDNGYYGDCDQYQWMLNRFVRGVLEVPVVHCSYLIRADVLAQLTYEDDTNRFEYVVFSHSARKAEIPQYLDNRQVYGYITFDEGGDLHVAGGIDEARRLLNEDLRAGDMIWSANADPLASIDKESSAKNLKTLVFCTAFAANPDDWNGRYRRWLDAIIASGLAYDAILLVDDGSQCLPDWPEVKIQMDGFEADQTSDKSIIIHHFQDHLGRHDIFDFPGWYRSFAFAGRYAAANGFEKIIHIESDSFLIGSRIKRYFNNAPSGWTAFWCPRHNFPESALQIIAGDAIKRFAEIETTHPHEMLRGREFESQLPFDRVEKRFTGDRYGEFLTVIPGNADYAVQVSSHHNSDFYWWLKPGSECQAETKAGSSSTPVEQLRQLYVINLDRSTERWRKFQARNAHVNNAVRVSAVDGALINRQELVDRGEITVDLPYGPGTLGCAMSHINLWKQAVAQNRVMTIMEDDVIIARNFAEQSARMITNLPPDWDIIQWGYIFTPTFTWLDFGFSKAELRFYENRTADGAALFQAMDFSPSVVRLAHSSGSQAYSLSPKGARILLEFCLPLRKQFVTFPGAGIVIEDEGLDSSMNGAYEKMQAFVSLPPLVIQDDAQGSDRKAIGG